MSTSRPMRFAAAGLAAVAVALGAYALGNSNSNSGSSGTANAAAFGQAPNSSSGSGPGSGVPQQNGGGPPGGFGTPVTGGTAQKVSTAALAKYSGTVEGVVKLGDGSYIAHVLTSNGEYHVTVSKNFKVTGAQQGGPGAGGPRRS
jgi:hypothetical protein